MAAITRIEVANFLGDGYEPGKTWIPFYRGETLRLAGVNGFGSSTAIQIPNGGGKTSLTEACLFLLTRNSGLKEKTQGRVSPGESSWSHVRIEFTERPLDDNPAQQQLIVIDQQDAVGTPYVVGLVWSRGKDPIFYRYQGVLEDAPCFQKDGTTLTLIENVAFMASVKRLERDKYKVWNVWGSARDWEQEIKFFCDTEVLKQNAQFQLDGAGDYSAVFNKVNNKNGDGYDVNFFRQIVAPELLSDPLGTEAGEGDKRFETTLLTHLRMSVDRLLDISTRQRELDAASAALVKFEPVEMKAKDVIAAERAYIAELNNVARDGAMIDALVRNKLPGMPNVAALEAYSGSKKLLQALSSMVITQREGVLITDTGLAKLCGVETFKLNEKGVDHWSSISQPIDLSEDVKESSIVVVKLSNPSHGSQDVEYKGDVKKSGRGGRRSSVNYYDLSGAIKAAAAVSNLSGAHTDGLDDILTRAFGIAIDEIDTNPYRRERRHLQKSIDMAELALTTAEADKEHWSNQVELLLRKRTDAQENQTAYETFKARAGDFLPEHINDPLAARKWAEDQLKEARDDLDRHHKKVVELTAHYKTWCDLNEQNMGIPLQEVLDTLTANFERAKEERNMADTALKNARARRSDLDAMHKTKSAELSILEKRSNRLEELSSKVPLFIEMYGDVDPEVLVPHTDLKDANAALRETAGALQRAELDKQSLEALRPAVKTFREIFGDADPAVLNPNKELRDHNEKIRVENEILTDHQPLVEALALFKEAHPTKLPAEWLEEAEHERQQLGAERQENQRRASEIKRELAELETDSIADNRVYADALAALKAGHVRYTRLNELIKEMATGDKLESLLTLFSSALSAPVIDSLEEADTATEILERANLTVPVFLNAPLLQFIERNEYQTSGKLVHSYLVGRRTRQVEVLLNPELIAEEREGLTTESDQLASRLIEIINRLRELQPTSHLIETALKAAKAIERKSKEKHAEASAHHSQLLASLAALELRASPQAVDSIGKMKDFTAKGGDDAYNMLIASTIPQLESTKQAQEKRIAQLQVLAEPPATLYLEAAKEYKREGGKPALIAARDAIAILKPAVENIATEIGALDDQINTVLSNNVEKATNALNLLNQTFQINKRDLETAVAFQATDGLDYMQRNEKTGKTLDTAISVAGNRTNGIDFERAARFVLPGNEDARSVADQIADAEGKRNSAEARRNKLNDDLVQYRGRRDSIIPFMEDLHKLIAAIRAQNSKISDFSDDIRGRMLSVDIDPELTELAARIQSACIGKQASTNEAAKTAIANLTSIINELEIDTKPLLARVDQKSSAYEAFQARRADFCEKARNGEIKGLQLPEIERISEARTIEQLGLIHQVKEKISASIKEHQDQLAVFKQAMEESKAATIDNMTRFARQAESNLAIMERVMQKSPNARFYVKADVADADKIRSIIESLIATIQEREAAARERGTVALNEDIKQRNEEYLDQIHIQVYQKIFSNPSVHFLHKAIRGGEKTRLTGDKGGLSGGQRTALMMMWLIKQADYALTRAVMNSDLNRRDQKAALRAVQRIMFFDGLFSNLSSDEIINDAFQGLSDIDMNFQLIGLIHNPNYVNNKAIFPVHLVGKKYSATKGGKRHCFMSIDGYENKLGFFQSAYRNNTSPEQPNA
ncbi:MAG TPA: hypothetical protein VGK09_05280 [Rhodocyclaceae bacterium]|jgi:hypothetical protein